MDDGQLIDLVHSYPFLYDKKRSDFKDTSKKNNAWAEIGCLIKYTAQECQERWKYLREKYLRVKKAKTSQPSGSSREEKADWEYLNALSWLDAYVQKRRTKCNLTNTLPEIQQDFSMESQDPLDTPADQNFTSSSRYIISSDEEVEESMPSCSKPTNSLNTTPTLGFKPLTKSVKANETSVASSLHEMGVAMKNVAETFKDKANVPAQNKRKGEDELFGELVSSTLANYRNCSRKKKLKKEIYNLLMDYSDDGE